MKTILLWSLITLTLILFVSKSVDACSCSGRDTTAKTYLEADTILIGTISKLETVKDKSGFSDLQATFLVDEVLKGKRADKIEVFTSSQGTACGYPFEEGSTYLVYAYRDEDPKELDTNICTRTRRLSIGILDDEIEVLRSLSKGRLEPRIYGIVYELTRGLYPLRNDYWDERRPMAGVKIIARKGNNILETVSDAKGRFSITNLQKGSYKLEFIVPSGYKLGGDYWDENTKDEKDQYKNIEVTITEKDSPDSLTIETRIDGRIGGSVLDANGKPVGKDVMVSLISKKTAEKEVGDIDYTHAFTEKDGSFEFFGIPPGEYYLGFNLETKPSKNFPYPRTYFPGTTEVGKAKIIVLGKAEKLEGVLLELPKKVEEIEVRGQVVDKDGNAIKGAIVERYGLYYGEWREGEPYSMKYIKQPTFEGRVETNEKGEFTLKLLKGNKYRLNSYLEEENSNKNLLEGDDVDVEVTDQILPVILVLDKKPK